MTKEIQELKARVHQYENRLEYLVKIEQEFGSIKKKNEELQSLLQFEKSKAVSNFERLQLMFSGMKKKAEEDHQLIKSLRAEVVDYQNEKQELLENVEILDKKKSRFREISLMSYEEICGLKNKEQLYIETITQIKSKMMEDKLRNREYMMTENIRLFRQIEENQLAALNENLKNEELFMINKFKEDFEKGSVNSEEGFFEMNSLSKILKLRKDYKKEFESTFKNLELDKNKHKKKSTNLSHLTLAKPTLFELVQFRVSELKPHETQEIISKNFHLLGLIRTIRVIFDSKWNEFCFYTSRKNYTSFSEFVYSWLGCFEYDIKQEKIVENSLSKKICK